MSRNRCSTLCECGFWDFNDAVPVGDSSLMTQREYFKAIGWEDCPYHENAGNSRSGGWGFRDDLNGKTFPAWRSKDGMSWTNAVYPRDPERWIYEPQTYASVPPDQRYRYRKIECPICRRRYVGWFVQQPKMVGGDSPVFEIYDTSFWDAYNDEPSDKDREGVINWSRDLLVEAAREFIARHPDRFAKVFHGGAP